MRVKIFDNHKIGFFVNSTLSRRMPQSIIIAFVMSSWHSQLDVLAFSLISLPTSSFRRRPSFFDVNLNFTKNVSNVEIGTFLQCYQLNYFYSCPKTETVLYQIWSFEFLLIYNYIEILTTSNGSKVLTSALQLGQNDIWTVLYWNHQNWNFERVKIGQFAEEDIYNSQKLLRWAILNFWIFHDQYFGPKLATLSQSLGLTHSNEIMQIFLEINDGRMMRQSARSKIEMTFVEFFLFHYIFTEVKTYIFCLVFF